MRIFVLLAILLASCFAFSQSLQVSYGQYVSSSGWQGSASRNYALFIEQATGAVNNFNLWSGPTNAVHLSGGYQTYGNNMFSAVNPYMNGLEGSQTVVVTMEDERTTNDIGALIVAASSGHSSGTRPNVYGFEANAYQSGSGGTTNAVGGIFTRAQTTAGTAINMVGITISPNLKTGGAVINNYGIRIHDQGNVGSNENVALWIQDQTQIGSGGISIKTGKGRVEFGDSVSIGPNSTPIVKHLSASFSLNLSTPAVPGCMDSPIQTMNNIALGDTVVSSMNAPLQAGQVLTAFLGAANQITFRVCQFSGSPLDPDGQGATYRADVWKH